MMNWHEVAPYLRELWHRPAGPMNWKNPIRVFAVAGWLVIQGFVLLGWAGWRVFQGLMLLGWAVLRAGQFVVALPALVLFFFAGLWYAVWSFVRRPFPSLDENPLLALVNYHTPNFFDWLVLWYYVSPFVAVMLSGLITITVWKVWLEGRRRDFAPFAKLPPWPLDPKQKAPAIVIGEVHHPVEAREIFSPSWLTIPERGLYTGVAIFGAVGSGKTSACMNPFARQLLGWQAGDPQMRAAALVLEVKGDFCHDIRQILVEAGRGQDYIELGMDARAQWNPLSAWWLDSYSLAYTVSSLLNQLFGKGTLLAGSRAAIGAFPPSGFSMPNHCRTAIAAYSTDTNQNTRKPWCSSTAAKALKNLESRLAMALRAVVRYCGSGFGFGLRASDGLGRATSSSLIGQC